MQEKENGLQKSGIQMNLTQFDVQQQSELTADQHIVEHIQDDLTALRNKQNKSPLSFYCQVTNTYLISFNQSECIGFMTRFTAMSAFIVLAQIFVQVVASVPSGVKTALICFCAVQEFSFLLLFYLDPGTLFEDEEEQVDQQRIYCQVCRLYRGYRTRHCRYCLKCVKGFDHHCGFFGKCIGRRNYLLFCVFLLSSGLNGAGSMGSIMFTLLKSHL